MGSFKSHSLKKNILQVVAVLNSTKISDIYCENSAQYQLHLAHYFHSYIVHLMY